MYKIIFKIHNKKSSKNKYVINIFLHIKFNYLTSITSLINFHEIIKLKFNIFIIFNRNPHIIIKINNTLNIFDAFFSFIRIWNKENYINISSISCLFYSIFRNKLVTFYEIRKFIFCIYIILYKITELIKKFKAYIYFKIIPTIFS